MKFLSGLMIGLVVGVWVGWLFFTPEGEERRAEIRHNVQQRLDERADR